MRYVLALLLVLSQVQASSAQGVSPQQVLTEALPKLQGAILSHPEALVREQLYAWLGDGRVKFATNNILPEMSVSLEKMGGKDQVLLWYNLGFVLQGIPEVAPVDRDDYLKLVLFHGVAQIQEHFNGKTRLIPVVPVGPVSEDSIAQTIWDLEWIGVTKEWELAKKLKKPYLVPVIAAATRNGETPRSFLNGFYLLQMGSHSVEFNRGLMAGFTARYKKELAKLAASRQI